MLILLGSEKKRLPLFVLFFFLASLLDLVGISLVGGYVSILTNPDSLMSEKIQSSIGWLKFDPNNDYVIAILGITLITVFVIKAAAAIVVNHAIIRFSNQQLLRLRVEAMDTFQRLPYTVFAKRNSSEYIQAVGVYTDKYTQSLTVLLRLASELIVAVSILSLLAAVNATLLGILVVIAALLFFTYNGLFGRRLKIMGQKSNTGSKLAFRGLQEGMMGLKEIRVLGRERYFLDMVRKGSTDLSKAIAFSQLMVMMPRYLVEAAIVLLFVSLAAVLQLFGSPSENFYPLLGMYSVAGLRLMPLVSNLIAGTATLRFGRPSITALTRDLQNPDVSERAIETPSSRGFAGETFNSLHLDGVTFTYPGAKAPTLRDISLSVSAGESIGLMGASSSGKTTLVDLILGLLEPQRGEIKYNGQPYQSVLADIRSHVAYLPQDAFLIDDTLVANVALDDRELLVDRDRLNDAIRQARLDSLVTKLPDGLNTSLGEHGVRLSGGERQRVALARAFYHQRDFLVMDEPTSALDPETEQEVIEELGRLKGHKTIVVIAHHPLPMRYCDRIYLLGRGSIIKQISYSELVCLKDPLFIERAKYSKN
jgi:ABC-type multidrug transport system fused ATPase/permease subunit